MKMRLSGSTIRWWVKWWMLNIRRVVNNSILNIFCYSTGTIFDKLKWGALENLARDEINGKDWKACLERNFLSGAGSSSEGAQVEQSPSHFQNHFSQSTYSIRFHLLPNARSERFPIFLTTLQRGVLILSSFESQVKDSTTDKEQG